ncbi:MAG: response regulator transcription factor [Chloroflexi bacterium]|nr:response regulator transcription factor [Chloroflexota bacterium]
MPDPTTKKISVLIVDDHAIVRQGLRTLLELMEDIEVVGEAANGQAAVEMASRWKPNVILMDLVMPEMDGILATQRICDLGSGARVIALTSFSDDEKIIQAIKAGAVGFLLKDVSPSDLVEAIRATYRGETRLHPNVARRLMNHVASRPAPPPPPSGGLTERELDVIRLVSEGMSNREIALKLVISEKTVKTHISSLLNKLCLEDRTKLAIYALKNGLVNQP